jgi:hypothetical protein
VIKLRWQSKHKQKYPAIPQSWYFAILWAKLGENRQTSKRRYYLCPEIGNHLTTATGGVGCVAFRAVRLPFSNRFYLKTLIAAKLPASRHCETRTHIRVRKGKTKL